MPQVEDVRTLWGVGDWSGITDLFGADCKNTTNEELLYIISALYQLGRIQEAQELIGRLNLTSGQRGLMARLLISGVYTSLGKAYACANDYVHAELLCKKALIETSNHPISAPLLNARVSEQFSQLGIPRLADNLAFSEFKPSAEQYLKLSGKYFFEEPAQQIALAEFYQLNERYGDAIVHWQNVSSLLSVDTPQSYYDRLKDAYKSVKGFPLGTLEQEALFGDTDKHQLLSEIHKRLQPDFYFEIGVQTGKSLALAKCEALGVDPMPMITQVLPATAKVLTCSSDSFFAHKADLLLQKSIDLCFIDGMHLFEYALRDFIYIEKYAKPYSLIVIDDIFPGHPDQARRERCTRAWTGDVWKVKETLEKYRPDLFVLAVDAFPTGLLLISALDSGSDLLADGYQTILNTYPLDAKIPDKVMSRDGAVSGKAEIIIKIINFLKLSKSQKNIDSITVKCGLEKLFLT